MELINRKISILTISTLLVLVASPVFQEGLHAAEQSQSRKTGSSEKKWVKADSLYGAGGLKSTITFAAKDSVIYNLDRRTMELWGKARIEHESTTVKAPEIVIDLNTSLLQASGVAESSKMPAEPAVFTDKQGSFTAETMSYDFKTGKGETSKVSSSSNQIFFGGEHVTRLENGELQIRDGSFTTCEEDDPHYWISSSNMTIIPDDRVTAKPLVMYVRPEIFSRRLPAIPILALPYMVFPLKEGRSSGFLTPSISNESNRGYYLSNLGYFWAIDDYMDLKLEGDISLNGSWRIGNRFRYTKSNIFSGALSGEYKRYTLKSDDSEHREWNAKIVHNQVFDPAMRLDVNLSFQGGDRIYDLNSMNSETIVTEQANSRASLARTFNDESSVAALYFDRTEDLRNHNTNDTVGASYFQNRIYPFRSGFSGESDDWKKDISITSAATLSGTRALRGDISSSGYAASADFELGYYREFAPGYKALFTQGLSFQKRDPVPGLVADDFNATTVVLPLRAQSTLFNHFNVNPGLTVSRFLNNDAQDRDFSTYVFSVDASTRLYGTLGTGLFENTLGLKAIRHTFIPTLTYAWNPSFTGTGYDFYHHLYDWTYSQLYNRFETTRYSGLPEGQNTVGITLKNLFHGKFRGSSAPENYDSVYGDHTVQLLSLSASTAYNFAADALQLAPLTVTAESNALSPNLLLSAGAMYDFYSYDRLTGERVNRFNSDDGNGLLRFVRGFLNMSFTLQGHRADGTSAPTSGAPYLMSTEQSLLRQRFNNGEFSDMDYGLPWQLKLALYLQSDKSNPLQPSTTSLINTSVRTSLSKNWQFAVNTGYDFQQREVIFPMLQLYRDLHCWQMSFQWVPSGSFRSYAIQIGLKAPQLKDIKIRQTGSAAALF